MVVAGLGDWAAVVLGIMYMGLGGRFNFCLGGTQSTSLQVRSLLPTQVTAGRGTKWSCLKGLIVLTLCSTQERVKYYLK